LRCIAANADDEIHNGSCSHDLFKGDAWRARGVPRIARATHVAIRFAAMQRNAAVLVERLRAHPEVAEVRYPGQGAMVSFIVKEGADAADACAPGVRVIVPATSLGGVETTIERRQKYAGDAHVPQDCCA